MRASLLLVAALAALASVAAASDFDVSTVCATSPCTGQDFSAHTRLAVPDHYTLTACTFNEHTTFVITHVVFSSLAGTVLDVSGWRFENASASDIFIQFGASAAQEIILPSARATPSVPLKNVHFTTGSNSHLLSIRGSIAAWSGSGQLSVQIVENTITSLSANFFSGLMSSKLSLTIECPNLVLPPGLFYGLPHTLTVPSSVISVNAASSSVYKIASTWNICDFSCTSSCTASGPTACCDGSCATCSAAHSATSCKTCFASETLVAGQCMPNPPFYVVPTTNPTLEFSYEAGRVQPRITTCFLHDEEANQFYNGFALDNKLCCRRQGQQVQVGSDFECAVGCSATNVASNIGVVSGTESTVGAACWTGCFLMD